MQEVRIVAELDLKPGHSKELLPVLKALVDSSRAEAGNRVYDLTQKLDNPDHFVVIETWVSEKALEEHMATPHFQAFAKAVDGKAERLNIIKLRDVFADKNA